MIIVSGFNVYPSDIEEVAMQHQKILELAVSEFLEKMGRNSKIICISC